VAVLEVSRQALRRMEIAESLPNEVPPPFTAVAAAVDGLPDPELLCAEERVAAMAAVMRQRNRLEAYLCDLAGAADAADDASILRAGSTSTLVAAATNQNPAFGSATVSRARALRELPEVAAAYREGLLSTAHVAVLCAEAHRVDDIDELEGQLVAVAACVDPRETRRLLTLLVDQSQPDGLDDAFRKNHEKRGVSLSRTPNGNWRIDGYLDEVAGRRLSDALATLTDRRQPGDDRSPKQRRADALGDLVAMAVANHKPLGVSQVSVLVDLDDLTRGELDDGSPLGPDLLFLVSCTAMLSVIFGRNTPDGFVPLAMGRAERFATPAQWKALIVRDRGCIRCGKPPRYCQAHHIIGWASGGETDLENLCLLCQRCHTQLHLGDYSIVMDHGLPVMTPQPSRAPPLCHHP
jgi:hypothetical protein